MSIISECPDYWILWRAKHQTRRRVDGQLQPLILIGGNNHVSRFLEDWRYNQKSYSSGAAVVIEHKFNSHSSL